MKGALGVGRVRNIGIYIHWTFLLLIAYVVINGVMDGLPTLKILYQVGFMLTVFLCVVLHELGHALSAMHYGIPTKDITLLPIGGVARLSRMPEDPRQELVVAIAGPAVNLLIALVIVSILFISGSLEMISPENIADNYNLPGDLFYVNLALIVFNLIPAFPMDGGRVLRSLLSMRLGRLKATRIASLTGQVFSVLFVIAGFFGYPTLLVIGIFIFFSARSEASDVEYSARQLKTAEELIEHSALVVSPTLTFSELIQNGYSGSPGLIPVVEQGYLTGILTPAQIFKGIQEFGVQGEVGRVMLQNYPVVYNNQTVREIINTANYHGLDILPVVKDGMFLGLISANRLSAMLQKK